MTEFKGGGGGGGGFGGGGGRGRRAQAPFDFWKVNRDIFDAPLNNWLILSP